MGRADRIRGEHQWIAANREFLLSQINHHDYSEIVSVLDSEIPRHDVYRQLTAFAALRN
mgnify:CR=1